MIQTSDRKKMFILFISILVLNWSFTFALKIEECWTKKDIFFTYANIQVGIAQGYIDAQLETDINNDVILVKNITFNGYVHYQNQPASDIDVKFSSIKAIKVQRIVEYHNHSYTDIVRRYCNLGIVYNDDIRLGVRRPLESKIFLHAEDCFQELLCNFDPNSHVLGDKIIVRSINRQKSNSTTSQDTINAIADLLINKLLKGLEKANKTLIKIPEFDVSFLGIRFSSKGGLADIIKYIKRTEDLYFYNEGHSYIVRTTATTTAGFVQLKDVKFSIIGITAISGELPINMTEAQLSIKTTINYNAKPCKITVNQIEMSVPLEAADFSKLKATFFNTVESVLSKIGGKAALLRFLGRRVSSLLQEFIESLPCNRYENALFKLKNEYY
ncbi:uncharacterized protein LOC107980928 isoform X1 [Nasonia vitripennis]|uniref:Lipid-binding serum glycoprotein N-terminal domain-containing protein n=1 Tax=Nasonia vitripennis TaxID=7425 RepID=A0A7M7IQW8_NASVI|nr:uncharacterized protein LOC107980928 isoform X1 [Nasonia vitripennis]